MKKRGKRGNFQYSLGKNIIFEKKGVGRMGMAKILYFGRIYNPVLVSDVPVKTQNQKTSLDPGKFGPDPASGFKEDV